MTTDEKSTVVSEGIKSVICGTPPRTQRRWNHYHCPICKGITVARHDDEGVTPFILRCRAKDARVNNRIIPSCQGHAVSCFFQCSQDDTQIPHVIFYRPAPMEAIEAINKDLPHTRACTLEHYQQGGSLMRLPFSTEPFPQPTKQ